jgi:hypothetical protein
MVPFHNLITAIREEAIDRHSNVWPTLHTEYAGGQVTSQAIETSMAQKWGEGVLYHFLDLFSVNIHITRDSFSFGMDEYDPQFRKHYTEVNP